MSDHFACSYIVSFNVHCMAVRINLTVSLSPVLEILFHCNLRSLSSGRSTFLVSLGFSPHEAVKMFLRKCCD